MKLKNFNYIVGILIFFSYSPLFCEDKIDIWKNKKEVIKENIQKEENNIPKKNNLGSSRLFKQ